MSAETHSSSTEWMADFLAGWISGAAAIVACQPVDTILTRWQAAPMTAHTSHHWRVMTLELYRTAGPAALWRGASPVIWAAPLQNALLMGGYGVGSRWFEAKDDEKRSHHRSRQLAAIFVGGCTGGERW
jgi:solute carrier family 25 (mitochondrial carnitine/acylcarnitine transporter), member 20/29